MFLFILHWQNELACLLGLNTECKMTQLVVGRSYAWMCGADIFTVAVCYNV